MDWPSVFFVGSFVCLFSFLFVFVSTFASSSSSIVGHFHGLGFDRVASGFIGLDLHLCWVLVGFAERYWVLPTAMGFYWLLLATGFDWVWPCFSGFN